MSLLDAAKQALEALNKYAYYDANKGYRCVACNTLHINSHLENCPLLIVERNLRTAIATAEKHGCHGGEGATLPASSGELEKVGATIERDYQTQIDRMSEEMTLLRAENAALKEELGALKYYLERKPVYAMQHRVKVLREALLSDSALAGRFHKLLATPDNTAELDALVRDADRWRTIVQQRPVLLITGFFGNGCVNRTIEDVERAIDAMKETQK